MRELGRDAYGIAETIVASVLESDASIP